MSSGPMCGWAEPCDQCAAENKRCYCYRITFTPDNTAPSPRAQLPEGD